MVKTSKHQNIKTSQCDVIGTSTPPPREGIAWPYRQLNDKTGQDRRGVCVYVCVCVCARACVHG